MGNSLSDNTIRHFRRYEHLARAGESCDCIYRVEEGWACRYCVLNDGRRQIAALYLPGDYCEPQWLLSAHAELAVMALTGMRTTKLSLSEIHGRRGENVKKMLGATVQLIERQTQWIISLGRKTAVERISELLGDLRQRLRADSEPVAIPLTQRDIADVVGLTPVHVNRVLQDLRRQGVVRQLGRTLLVAPKAAEIDNRPSV